MQAVERAGQMAHRLVAEVLRHVADADALMAARAVEPEAEPRAQAGGLACGVVGPAAADRQVLRRR